MDREPLRLESRERVSRLALVLVAVIPLLASGCSDPVAPSPVSTPSPLAVAPVDQRAALAHAEARWASWRLRNYDFTVDSPCGLCPRLPRQVRFEVRDGVGQAVGLDDTTAAIFSGMATIDLIFASMRAALDRPAFRFAATYHPIYGYPLDYFVDYEEFLQDDGTSLTIAGFVPR